MKHWSFVNTMASNSGSRSAPLKRKNISNCKRQIDYESEEEDADHALIYFKKEDTMSVVTRKSIRTDENNQSSIKDRGVSHVCVIKSVGNKMQMNKQCRRWEELRQFDKETSASDSSKKAKLNLIPLAPDQTSQITSIDDIPEFAQAKSSSQITNTNNKPRESLDSILATQIGNIDAIPPNPARSTINITRISAQNNNNNNNISNNNNKSSKSKIINDDSDGEECVTRKPSPRKTIDNSQQDLSNAFADYSPTQSLEKLDLNRDFISRSDFNLEIARVMAMIEGLSKAKNTDFMCGNINLWEITANGPIKFGLKCVDKCFSKDEIMRCTLCPSSRTDRPALDQNIVNLIKDCMFAKYKSDVPLLKLEHAWSQINKKVNTRGRNLKYGTQQQVFINIGKLSKSKHAGSKTEESDEESDN